MGDAAGARARFRRGRLRGRADPARRRSRRGCLRRSLVADGRACGIDELVEAAWDRQAPASARKLVQVYVSQLRKVLPPAIAILTVDGGYAARARAGRARRRAVRAAAPRMRRGARRQATPRSRASLAEQALSLWRGRAYGELAYEDFARGESERLEELRLVAIEERLAALLELGRARRSARRGARPRGSERPPRALARARDARAVPVGRQADALEHYAVVARAARRRARARARPGASRAAAPHPPAGSGPRRRGDDAPRQVHALPVSPNPLVGRERELDELRALLDRRESRLIVLTGAGGSGKTRLALEVARQSRGLVCERRRARRARAAARPRARHADDRAGARGLCRSRRTRSKPSSMRSRAGAPARRRQRRARARAPHRASQSCWPALLG